MTDPITKPSVDDPTGGPGPRRVLVNGADSGIGKACAVALADEAEHVAVVAALELAEHGITVNAVVPGEIATPMKGQEDESVLEGKHRPGVPLGRPGDAREVAAVVRLLCRPEGGYVTGASWAVDGGMPTMGPMAGSHLRSDDWRRP